MGCAQESLMERYSLALLSYVSKHPNESQTLKVLAEVTGVPWATIAKMFEWHEKPDDKHPCYLCMAAWKYGFVFRVKRGWPHVSISAVRVDHPGRAGEPVYRHPGFCDECGGPLDLDKRGEYVCRECGLVQSFYVAEDGGDV